MHYLNVAFFIAAAHVLAAGGGVYVQSEYLTTNPGNILFADIVNSNGGTFGWISTMNGDLDPVTILGCWGTDPEVVSPLGYFWYGCQGSGSGTGFSDLMLTGSTSIGYDYCLPAPNHGRVATTTDQDWLHISTATANSEALMRNIIARLAHPTLCSS